MAKTVYVGLSGGVDSSVAALRLKNAGYNVVGVFIKVWHPDWMVCNWEEERLDAMRVAAHLNIPFLTCDAITEYRDGVANYFIDSYKAGLTPNPDVMCNKTVKFGAFMKFAKENKADYIATGHYAQKGGDTVLVRGLDNNKDQSYFLWSLTKEQLNNTLFPIGDTIKENIRQEAKMAGLSTATKKDSQGVCFLGHIDIPDFLSHYIDLKNGPVLNEANEVIGEHAGAFVYTVGQRHGFTVYQKTPQSEPWYIVNKNIDTNTITVSHTMPTIYITDEIILNSICWRGEAKELYSGNIFQAQTRYRQTPFKVEVLKVIADQIVIKPLEKTEKSNSGQSCVLYQDNICLGGGIIV